MNLIVLLKTNVSGWRRRNKHERMQTYFFTVSNMRVLHNVCAPFKFRCQIACLSLLSPQGVIHSILCQRLMLRLRGAYESLTVNGRQALRLQGATTLLPETAFPMSVLGKASEKWTYLQLHIIRFIFPSTWCMSSIMYVMTPSSRLWGFLFTWCLLSLWNDQLLYIRFY